MYHIGAQHTIGAHTPYSNTPCSNTPQRPGVTSNPRAAGRRRVAGRGSHLDPATRAGRRRVAGRGRPVPLGLLCRGDDVGRWKGWG